MSHGTQETEIKLAVKDARSARRLLRMAGFVVSRQRVFEANTVFDTPELSLRTASSLLRIREAGRVATITYKGVPQVGKHKSREELEVQIDKAAAMMAIVERLGYRPRVPLRKVPHRVPPATARRRGHAGRNSDRRLPGTGRHAAWIDRTARRLGFQESDYITASYGRIYLDWCAANGRAPGDMTFE